MKLDSSPMTPIEIDYLLLLLLLPSVQYFNSLYLLITHTPFYFYKFIIGKCNPRSVELGKMCLWEEPKKTSLFGKN